MSQAPRSIFALNASRCVLKWPCFSLSLCWGSPTHCLLAAVPIKSECSVPSTGKMICTQIYTRQIRNFEGVSVSRFTSEKITIRPRIPGEIDYKKQLNEVDWLTLIGQDQRFTSVRVYSASNTSFLYYTRRITAKGINPIVKRCIVKGIHLRSIQCVRFYSFKIESSPENKGRLKWRSSTFADEDLIKVTGYVNTRSRVMKSRTNGSSSN